MAALVSGWRVGALVAGGLVVAAIGLWVLLLWAVAHRRERVRVVAVVALGGVVIGAGFAVAAAWREYRVSAHPLRAVAGQTAQVVLTPTGDPKAVRAKAFGGERWVVRAELRSYRRGGVDTGAGGAVVVLASGAQWAQVLPGRPVAVRARVESPRRHDLTVATLFASGPPEVAGELPWWQGVAGVVRRRLSDAAAGALSPDAAGVVPALVAGDTSKLPEQVEQDFEIAGLEHLLVVSGANFTLLLAAVLCVTRFLTLGPRTSVVLAAVVLLLFVVVARPDPSVLRAAAMGAVTLLALLTGRRKQALPALCTAVIGLLAVWPELAVRAGFALSVLATAGLILLAPSWADWLRARGCWRRPAEALAVAVAAFVVTTPLLIALSGRISVVSILANVLVEPVIGPITVLGVLGAVLAVFWMPGAELVLWCAKPFVWWLCAVAERLAAVPGAEITVPGGAAGGLAAAALLAVGVIGLRSRRVRRIAAVVAIGFGAVLIPVRLWHPGWPTSGWIVAACDVGQGDGFVLAVARGSAIVVDVGPEPRAMRACLDRLGINTIPLLILSHPHADHIGGLAGALQGRAVAAIAVGPGELVAEAPRPANHRAAHGVSHAASGGHGESGDIRTVIALAHAGRIPLIELAAGEVFRFGTVELDILAPIDSGRRPTQPLPNDEANNRSIILTATTATTRILFTGDAEADAQRALLRSGALVRADILKVPHHGSRTTAPEFLEAVHPRLALVSVGADNTFGHPNPAILAQLAGLGAAVARTDRQGDILVATAGPHLRTLTAHRRDRAH
ncbi:ComEC/Rec2 family competence protein [Nocardia panacis]|uniref:ComEC/Rec2 family competence protein n=1 Tax=Nocardia panacis TaxID=2340916 RepID=A0A3A4KLH5_9NOCA|nr:ComEC/Rec2 family competence protein [Nocardia panacis]